MLIKEKIDFSISKNIFVASVILVAGIGGLQFQFFPQVVNGVTTYSITITSVAVAMILGILVNLVLKDDDKKEVESNEELIEEEKNILDNK